MALWAVPEFLCPPEFAQAGLSLSGARCGFPLSKSYLSVNTSTSTLSPCLFTFTYHIHSFRHTCVYFTFSPHIPFWSVTSKQTTLNSCMSPTEFGIAFLSTWNREYIINYKYFDAQRIFHKILICFFLYARLGLAIMCTWSRYKLAEKITAC